MTSPEEQEPAGPREPGVGRVLIVEDDVALGASLRLALLDEGFEVVHVGTARDGLRRLAEAPDVVLLNLGLPDGDGVDLCRHLREVTGVPVIIVSARGRGDDIGLGLAAGADDYVPKPFLTAELADRVRALLRPTDPCPGPRVVGELEVDPRAGTVRVGGRTTSLSRTEFRLVWELLDRPGTPVSRQDLMRRIWGRAPVAGPAALEARVRAIRNQLGPEAIHSVDGGYALGTGPALSGGVQVAG